MNSFAFRQGKDMPNFKDLPYADKWVNTEIRGRSDAPLGILCKFCTTDSTRAMLFWLIIGALASIPSVEFPIFRLFLRRIASSPSIVYLCAFRRSQRFGISKHHLKHSE